MKLFETTFNKDQTYQPTIHKKRTKICTLAKLNFTYITALKQPKLGLGLMIGLSTLPSILNYSSPWPSDGLLNRRNPWPSQGKLVDLIMCTVFTNAIHFNLSIRTGNTLTIPSVNGTIRTGYTFSIRIFSFACTYQTHISFINNLTFKTAQSVYDDISIRTVF